MNQDRDFDDLSVEYIQEISSNIYLCNTLSPPPKKKPCYTKDREDCKKENTVFDDIVTEQNTSFSSTKKTITDEEFREYSKLIRESYEQSRQE